MERDSGIGTSGAQLAGEIMENELVMKNDDYQNGNMVILAQASGIWRRAESPRWKSCRRIWSRRC